MPIFRTRHLLLLNACSLPQLKRRQTNTEMFTFTDCFPYFLCFDVVAWHFSPCDSLRCLGHISAGRVVPCGSVECGSTLDIPLASRGCPPRLHPALEGLGLSPGARGAPKKGMPTGPEAFLEQPEASRLRSCDRTNLRRPHSYAGGAYDKYRLLIKCQPNWTSYLHM